MSSLLQKSTEAIPHNVSVDYRLFLLVRFAPGNPFSSERPFCLRSNGQYTLTYL